MTCLMSSTTPRTAMTRRRPSVTTRPTTHRGSGGPGLSPPASRRRSRTRSLSRAVVTAARPTSLSALGPAATSRPRAATRPTPRSRARPRQPSCPSCGSPRRRDTTALPDSGETVTYTVKVSNVGPGDYTDDHPATFTDDLSDVLDDADYVTDSVDASTGTPTVSVDDKKLSWTGALASGEEATITYQVTYNGEGDTAAGQQGVRPRGRGHQRRPSL